MTFDPATPPLRAKPEEAQVNLRADLSHEIATAQSALEGQLAELERAGLAGGDSALVELLRGQLKILHGLNDMLPHATGGTLAQLRAEVNTSVAAARSITQQAQTSIASAHSSEAAHRAEEYARASEALDRKVAPTFTIDRDNNALAHAMAKRFGIDLSDYDKEREELEAQKRAAILRGDKLAERELDVRLAQNTLQALDVASAPVTEPNERIAVEKAKQAQEQVLETRTAALGAQRELVRAPESASAVVADAYDNAKSSSDFAIDLGGPQPIALSNAEDAHTKVEAPLLAAAAGTKPQSRA